jgi:predicted DNA-binding transcriptional regulator YafY
MACEAVLSFGPAIEVLAPAAMRRRVAREARATASLYTT